MVPIDLEAEEVDVELLGLGDVEYPQERDRLKDLHGDAPGFPQHGLLDGRAGDP